MSYRDRRSPDRGRERYPPSAPIDSYIPPTSSRASRPRSRSPGDFRARSRTPPRPTPDSWRGRPASPPRRYDARADSFTSRDTRPRSPRRDYAPAGPRYDDVSRPARERSPPPVKRDRDPSPYGRGGRSSPPPKRERLSPGRDYGRPRSPPRRPYSPPRDIRASHRPRSRSPRREDPVDPYASKSWRRQSPEPRVDSGRNSHATSRRSSPRPYTRRPADAASLDEHRNAPASSYRSPAPRDPPAGRPRSPYRHETEPSRQRAGSERDFQSREPTYGQRDEQVAAVAIEHRERAPPTGPASSYRDGPTSAISPPTGPSSSAPSMSAHNRGAPPSAPAYAQGGYGSYRGRGGPPSSRDYPPPRRGAPVWTGGYGRGSTPRETYAPHDTAGAFENRASLPRRDSNYSGNASSFRGSSNSTSMTYPRTQRFNQALSGVPEIKSGGEKLPALHDTAKADKLEEEAARLRKLIDDKEMKKRQGLREWEKLERESSNASLRSELAEEHLRSLNGEGEGMAAAF